MTFTLITTAKIAEYQLLLTNQYQTSVTAAQFTQALNANVITIA